MATPPRRTVRRRTLSSRRSAAYTPTSWWRSSGPNSTRASPPPPRTRAAPLSASARPAEATLAAEASRHAHADAVREAAEDAAAPASAADRDGGREPSPRRVRSRRRRQGAAARRDGRVPLRRRRARRAARAGGRAAPRRRPPRGSSSPRRARRRRPTRRRLARAGGVSARVPNGRRDLRAAAPVRHKVGEFDKKRPIASVAVYCKASSAGVSVSLNNTEYRGAGDRRPAADGTDQYDPLAATLTVAPLPRGMPFVLATAAYDDAGKVVGSIGATSAEVVTTLPLPRLLLWAYLARGAAQPRLRGRGGRRGGAVERALEASGRRAAALGARPDAAAGAPRGAAASARRRRAPRGGARRCCSPHSCAPPSTRSATRASSRRRASGRRSFPQAEPTSRARGREAAADGSADLRADRRRRARWAGRAGAVQWPRAAARLRQRTFFLLQPLASAVCALRLLPAAQLAASRRTPRLLVRLTYERRPPLYRLRRAAARQPLRKGRRRRLRHRARRRRRRRPRRHRRHHGR